MECWTWTDGIVYCLCTLVALCWHLPPLGVLFALIKLPTFLFVELPLKVVREFKLVSLDRRYPDRAFSTLFEYCAIMFVRWVLSTFQTDVIRKAFFGEYHARMLFNFRKIKYGTENVGDFDYYSTVPVSACENGGVCVPRGYWVRSKSRLHMDADLVLFFVPGNMCGTASSYVYMEYLAMLLVELQVQGFRNPAVFCMDIDVTEYEHRRFGFAAMINTVSEGWNYTVNEFQRAKTVFMGSGIGGTILLNLLLHYTRPFIGTYSSNDIALPTSTSSCNASYVDDTSFPQEVVTTPARFEACDDAQHSMKFYSLPGDLNEATTTQLEEVLSPNSSFFANGNFVSLVENTHKMPDALLLVSPITRFTMQRKETCPDFLTNRCLQRLERILVNEEERECLWTKPTCIRDMNWWSEAVPKNGAVVMYGGKEVATKEIGNFLQKIKTIESIKVINDVNGNEVHAWPITRSFLSRDSTSRLEGITKVADHIAKMLVMDCLCGVDKCARDVTTA